MLLLACWDLSFNHLLTPSERKRLNTKALLIKAKLWAYRRLKTNMERTSDEACWVHICIYKKAKEIGKVLMKKVATNRKKQDS